MLTENRLDKLLKSAQELNDLSSDALQRLIFSGQELSAKELKEISAVLKDTIAIYRDLTALTAGDGTLSVRFEGDTEEAGI